jgi:hypothetical protein
MKSTMKKINVLITLLIFFMYAAQAAECPVKALEWEIDNLYVAAFECTVHKCDRLDAWLENHNTFLVLIPSVKSCEWREEDSKMLDEITREVMKLLFDNLDNWRIKEVWENLEIAARIDSNSHLRYVLLPKR